MKFYLPFLSSTIGVFSGFVISYPQVFGICHSVYVFAGKTGCSDRSIELVGQPLMIFSVFVLIPSVILMFSKKNLIRPVIKFAIWWIPLSILLIATTPTSSGTWMPLYFVSREMITWIMGGLFTLISLILIVRSFFKKS